MSVATIRTPRARAIPRDGERGARGREGPRGPQGEPGRDGKDGKDGVDGQDGKRGRPGADGKDGKTIIGPQGPKGDRGEPGPKGEKGDAPAHEWSGTKLRFENPDGSWGDFVELRGPAGQPVAVSMGGGGSSGFSDAPADGNEYVRKNGAWVVATGGGSLTADDISADIAADETLTTVDEALEKVVGDIELPDLTLLLDNALV